MSVERAESSDFEGAVEGCGGLGRGRGASASLRGSSRSGSQWLRANAGSPLLRGALEALLVPLAFVALGLAWWPMGPIGAFPTAPSYAGVASILETHGTASMDAEEPTSGASETLEEWLVDGFNVVQVGLLRDRDREGWWSRARREELMARAERFARPRAATWVVFDGPEEGIRSEASGRLHEVYAASADEWLVARVRAAEEPSRIVVVTADRRLANRVRHHGGRVVAPAEFLRECGPLEVRSV